jgi:hypothetical protein
MYNSMVEHPKEEIQEVEEIVKDDIQTPPQGNNKSGVYPKKKP